MENKQMLKEDHTLLSAKQKTSSRGKQDVMGLNKMEPQC